MLMGKGIRHCFLVLAWKAQGREKRKTLAGRGGPIRKAFVPQCPVMSAVLVLVVIICSGVWGGHAIHVHGIESSLW